MNRALIALKLCDCLPDVPGDWIGCDRGALFLIENGIAMKAAVGDFDSVRPEEKKRILDACGETQILPSVKDDSDSEAAIRWALSRGYDEVWLVGGLGGRADHTTVNLRLVMNGIGKVFLYDRANLIRALGPGTHTVRKNGWKYVSVFTPDEACITLSGMKYPLTERHLTADDIYTVSNEITAETGIVTVHSGRIWLMQCRD